MGPLRQTSLVAISDSSQIALARRVAHEGAQRVGMDPRRIGEAEIVAVELATNLLHHAGSGCLLVNAFVPEATLEIVSVDHGPGMANVEECLIDGYSTGSTPGLGLGSIRRLSSHMEAYSWPGKGTVLAAQLAVGAPIHSLPGVICVALEGEEASGDRWAQVGRDGKELYLLVDGLGHGMYAAAAAEMAVEIFLGATSASPAALIELMHGPMRSTRGAAVVVVALDREKRSLQFAGIGNISAGLFAPDGRGSNLVSHNGTVGHQMRRVQMFEYPWNGAMRLVAHSDGLTTKWKLGDYPGLSQAGPAVMAGVLFRDFRRERDDATVMVVGLD